MRKALVCGAGGFIGSHLVKSLKGEGYWVRGVDLKYPKWSPSPADEFIIGDLTHQSVCEDVFSQRYNEVYQLAADMGGAEYIFTGKNDASIMYNSVLINLNVLRGTVASKSKKIFFSSSACVYPDFNQLDLENSTCEEKTAYPAYPDSNYGWEKLFSERLYQAFHKNGSIKAYLARLHNVFGEEGEYEGGREKAPAAICRKICLVKDGGVIEIFGDGNQRRTFLYIDECLEGIRRLVKSDFCGPVNIGSTETVSINGLVEMVADIAGKKIKIKHIKGPLGVRSRSSHNKLIKEKLGWEPTQELRTGMEKLYRWIKKQTESKHGCRNYQ